MDGAAEETTAVREADDARGVTECIRNDLVRCILLEAVNLLVDDVTAAVACATLEDEEAEEEFPSRRGSMCCRRTTEPNARRASTFRGADADDPKLLMSFICGIMANKPTTSAPLPPLLPLSPLIVLVTLLPLSPLAVLPPSPPPVI